jgi:hypothetical protein
MTLATLPVNRNGDGRDIVLTPAEQMILAGDMQAVKEADRAKFVVSLCDSLGLDWRTQPFQYIVLNNKLTLYARKACTDQLRFIHRIGVEIMDRQTVGDIHIVKARATMPSGRQDESVGAVNIKALAGDNLANAFMKAETKAKRRVTLSICGLGMLDETELETIPGAQQQRKQPQGVKALEAEFAQLDARVVKTEELHQFVKNETQRGHVVDEEIIDSDEQFYLALAAMDFTDDEAEIIYKGYADKLKGEYERDIGNWRTTVIARVRANPEGHKTRLKAAKGS